jgi:hypothetical protein
MPTNNNPTITLDPNTFESQSRINELNEQLQLSIPNSVLTEYIEVWNKFHHLCRFIFINELMYQADIEKLKKNFENIPDQNKDAFVQDMMQLCLKQDEQNDEVNAFIIYQDTAKQINEILPKLPEDLQKRVISIMQNGRDIYDDPEVTPEENLADLEAQLVEYDALEAFRTIRANPLNTTTVGGVLSKDDIAHIIDSDYDSDYDFDEEYTQPRLQAPLPAATAVRPEEGVELPPITTPGEYITASPTASQRAQPLRQPVSQPTPTTLRAPAPGKPLIIPTRKPITAQQNPVPTPAPQNIVAKPVTRNPTISPADQSVTDYYSRPVNGIDDLLGKK